MNTSPRLGISYPQVTPSRTDVPDVPQHFKNIINFLDLAVLWYSGTDAARPTSTAGSPGLVGRAYFASDTVKVYLDYGTGWLTIYPQSGIADGSVTGGAAGAGVKIAAHTITHDNIVAGTITGAELANNIITAALIANALKPSAGAGAATEALRALGTAAGQAAAGIHHAQHGALGADPLDLSGYNLAPLASPTFTGTVNLAALIASGAVTIDGILEILAAAPSFRMYENDQALDEGMWGLRASSGAFLLETRHDDGSLGTTLMSVNGRVGSGVNPTNIDFVNVYLRNKGMNAHRHPYLTTDRHIESGTTTTINTGGSVSVTFTDPFGSTPTVGPSGDTGRLIPGVTSVSTTGATFGVGSAQSGATAVYWHAEGAD